MSRRIPSSPSPESSSSHRDSPPRRSESPTRPLPSPQHHVASPSRPVESQPPHAESSPRRVESPPRPVAPPLRPVEPRLEPRLHPVEPHTPLRPVEIIFRHVEPSLRHPGLTSRPTEPPLRPTEPLLLPAESPSRPTEPSSRSTETSSHPTESLSHPTESLSRPADSDAPHRPPTGPVIEQLRKRYFNVDVPFEVTEKDFDDQWAYVSNVWTSFNITTLKNGDKKTVWMCRLNKHRHSSTRKEGVPPEKTRKRRIRDQGQCFAKIRTTLNAETGIVRVERFASTTPEHTHSLDESDRVKRPKILRDLVAEEAAKAMPGKPPAILETVQEIASRRFGAHVGEQYLQRKEVANIRLKVRGLDVREGRGTVEAEAETEAERARKKAEEMEARERRGRMVQDMLERMKETYRRIEDKGDLVEVTRFVDRVKVGVNPVLDEFEARLNSEKPGEGNRVKKESEDRVMAGSVGDRGVTALVGERVVVGPAGLAGDRMKTDSVEERVVAGPVVDRVGMGPVGDRVGTGPVGDRG
ncbi:hypothetical protein BC938DRAFT_478487 [Jimgerdemannia flammicorona]|uniref:FAR1 domain-containing protein n=1 Tax=Jimgerdemannia flammicorona TaxID=994334 RepID=A0A433QMU1_9FUNG|nr:hypothetical protein BC938DRAFT_478487 [Jimgerdemannia flammicorona]